MKRGIDIHKALEILGERSKEDTGHHHHEHHGDSENAKGCKHNAPEEAKHWGQTIDMDDDKIAEVVEKEEASLKAQKEVLEEERKKRRHDLETQMAGMTFKELVDLVFHTQEQRVATYRAYDKGLDGVLKTGNLSRYPGVCAEATASFSVLSESINHARMVLDSKFAKTAVVLIIGRLQAAEKEKLNYTAALHLEQIRSQAHLFAESDLPVEQGGTTISSMLQEDVRTLKQKIAASMETVNEVLDELRFLVVEEEA